MNVMSFFKKKQLKELYFGLYFTENRVEGFVFELVEQKPVMLSKSAYDITDSYDKILQSIDLLISDLESPGHLTIGKTIFFLHSSLLDDVTHEIKEPYKGYLKKASKELELDPLGYIDVHDAVEMYLKEISVINSLTLEFSQQHVKLFVCKGGMQSHMYSATRTSSVTADVQALFATVPSGMILPTKLYIYGSVDLTQIIADIAAFPWDEKVFIQHPVIEVLKDMQLYTLLAQMFTRELSTHEQSPSPVAAPTTAPSVMPVAPPSFGFVIGGDVSTVQSPVIAPKPVLAPPPRTLFTNIPTFHMPHLSFHSSGSRLALITGVVCIVLVGILGGTYEYFFHRTTVNLYVPSEELKKSIDLTIPVGESASGSALIAVKKTKAIELQAEKETTGKRDVGEKAKGDVIIHNFDNAEKTLDRGTKLQNGNLTFTLDTSVKIASSSGITSEGLKQSGKAKASVTASDIGSEYNLKKDTKFTIDSLSESLFVAFADTSFSGGTKKQVTTVSKTDIESLEKKTQAESEKKATDEMKKLAGPGEVVVPQLTKSSVSDTSVSHEVGTEAKNLVLKASTDIVFYTVLTTHLKARLLADLTKNSKQGFSLDRGSLTYEFTSAKLDKAGDTVEASVAAVVRQYLTVTPDDVVLLSFFKSKSQLRQLLAERFHTQDVVFDEHPYNLPFILWMPLFKKNITVVVLPR